MLDYGKSSGVRGLPGTVPLLCALYSLSDGVVAHVQVAVADPLDLEPVPEVVVAAAAELDLRQVQCSLHETASWRVRVLVELDAVLQALGQGQVHGELHEEAEQGRYQQQHVEAAAEQQVGLQHRLPLGELYGVQRVVANFTPESVDPAGQHAHQNQQVGHQVALVVVHHLAPLPQLDLEKDSEGEEENPHDDGDPVEYPESLSQLHPLLQGELHRHERHSNAGVSPKPANSTITDEEWENLSSSRLDRVPQRKGGRGTSHHALLQVRTVHSAEDRASAVKSSSSTRLHRRN